MKAYKIAVPVADVIHGEHQTITRQEIHELIKAHAEKLGWKSYGEGWDYRSDTIILWNDGDMTYGESKDDSRFQEISPFDFLKLTPEDVVIKPELTKEEIDILTFKHPTTTDHNKQALLEAFTAGWDAAHNNRFSIGVNFDKWYHEKAGNK